MRCLPYSGIDLSVRHWRLLPKPLANLVILKLNPSDLAFTYIIMVPSSISQNCKHWLLDLQFTDLCATCGSKMVYLAICIHLQRHAVCNCSAVCLLFNHVCEYFVLPCLGSNPTRPSPTISQSKSKNVCESFGIKEVRYLALRKGRFSLVGESFSFGQRGIESAC